MKKFKITFIEKTRHFPQTRTVIVEANDAISARYAFTSQFDSLTYNKELRIQVPSNKRVEVINFEEVKDKKENENVKMPNKRMRRILRLKDVGYSNKQIRCILGA